MDEEKIKRIENNIRKNPTSSDRRISNSVKVRIDEVRKVRANMNGEVAQPQDAAFSGIRLSNRRVLSRRPAESASKFIKRLPKGRGFEATELSKEWGIAENTIKRHARDMKCLRYVEVEEDEWRPMVLNPETAENYPS